MKDGTCSTCMWWWDLYDTDERQCYNRESPLFHQQTSAETKCACYVTLARARKELKLGTYQKHKKEACSGEA